MAKAIDVGSTVTLTGLTVMTAAWFAEFVCGVDSAVLGFIGGFGVYLVGMLTLLWTLWRL